MSDLIDRQAAVDGVKTLHDVAWKNWHEPTLSANVVLDMIRELPSAQPERKTGRWIWQTEDKYECSCCHDIIRVKEIMNVPQYITCPMCDAKMEVSE